MEKVALPPPAGGGAGALRRELAAAKARVGELEGRLAEAERPRPHEVDPDISDGGPCGDVEMDMALAVFKRYRDATAP
eukprot:6976405-Lingulodinium_polyedra.AAC.1